MLPVKPSTHDAMKNPLYFMAILFAVVFTILVMFRMRPCFSQLNQVPVIHKHPDTTRYDFIVTGGAGFIGHHMVSYILEQRPLAKILVLDDLSRGSVHNLKAVIDRVTFVQTDLRSQEKSVEYIRNADTVIHLADVVAGIDYIFYHQPTGQWGVKRRKLRFLTANNLLIKKRTPERSIKPQLPSQFVVLLEEGLQNDYITDWGRCCVAGTGSSGSSSLTSRQKCFVDLTNLEQLSLTILDSKHLHVVESTKKSLVKIEVLVYA